jgi:hypothetical protein
MTSTEKTCCKCGVTKPLDEFNRNCRKKDGHQENCKICHRAYAKAWKEAKKLKDAEEERQKRRNALPSREPMPFTPLDPRTVAMVCRRKGGDDYLKIRSALWIR